MPTRGRFKVDDQERVLRDAPKDPGCRSGWKRVTEAVSRARGEAPEAKVVGLDRQRERGIGRERSTGANGTTTECLDADLLGPGGKVYVRSANTGPL